jgi:transcriptional antiterminator
MGKKDRKEKILSIIWDASHPIRIEEIAEKTGYSLSTIRRELRSIEEILFNYGVEIKHIPYKGIHITNLKGNSYIDLISLMSQNERLSDKERCKLMIRDLLLSKEKITLENWEEKFNVSRPTIVKDFKKVKKWIINHKLNVIAKPHYGIKLIGEEKYIRQGILDLILENLSEEEKGKLLNEILLNYKANLPWVDVFTDSFFGIIKFLNEIEKIEDIKFTDDSFLHLLLIIGISISRLKEGYKLENIELNDRDLNPPFDILESLYDLNLDINERNFIILYLLSSELETGKTFLKEDKDLRYIIEKGIFNSYSFKSNTFRVFLNYLQIVIFKIKNNISIYNPMLEKIKKNYPIIYYISSELSKTVEKKYNIQIPEEAKGYITLYLLRLFERMAKKKKIIVICPSGVLTANLLAERIRKIFDDVEIVKITSLRELPKIPSKGFIYISTIPLSDFGSTYFQISPLFSKDEEEKLKNYIYNFYKGKIYIDILEIKNEKEIYQYVPENSTIITINNKLYWIFSKEETQEEKFILFYNLHDKSYYMYIHLFDYFKTIWLSQRIASSISFRNLNRSNINKDYLLKLLYSLERGL